MQPGNKRKNKNKPGTTSEYELQKRWHELPLGFPLKTCSGHSFTILAQGLWNSGPGPDFKGAKLDFSGHIRHGDIEIHRKSTDWIQHGHSENPDYGKVILHVVGTDDADPGNIAFLPDIPVFLLQRTQPLPARADSPNGRGKCSGYFATMDQEELSAFLRDAGMDRLHIKSKILLEGMIRDGAEKTFLSKLFDFMGIPNNRSEFKELSERFFAHPEQQRIQNFAPVLWGESGLLPDPSLDAMDEDARDLVRQLWNRWWILRRTARKPLTWKRNMRPLNSIERRIAFLCCFQQKFTGNPLSFFADRIRRSTSAKKCVHDFFEELTLHDSFWDRHTSFHNGALKKSAGITGKSFITELLTNVVAPSAHAFALLENLPELREKSEAFYREIPGCVSNSILRRMSEYCFKRKKGLFADAAMSQGAIHLYRSHCEKHSFDCRGCALLNSFYNKEPEG